jgi:hypothetical protein
VGKKKENNLKHKSTSVYMITQTLRRIIYGIIAKEKDEGKIIKEYVQICSIYGEQTISPIFQIFIPNSNFDGLTEFIFPGFFKFSELSFPFYVSFLVSSSLVFSSPSSPIYFDYYQYLSKLLSNEDSNSFHLSLSLMVFFIFYFLFFFLIFHLFF